MTKLITAPEAFALCMSIGERRWHAYGLGR
jgi:hypothetical protein